MLVPAFIVAEATLSYVGLGFPEPVASWGTMLHDASNVRDVRRFSVAAQPGGGDVPGGARPEPPAPGSAAPTNGADVKSSCVCPLSLTPCSSPACSRPSRPRSIVHDQVDARAAPGGARAVVCAPAHRIRGPRIERRSGAPGRGRIRSRDRCGARAGAARTAVHRRHRPRVDAAARSGGEARGGARRRRGAGADAGVLQGADDHRRVRAPLHARSPTPRRCRSSSTTSRRSPA